MEHNLTLSVYTECAFSDFLVPLHKYHIDFFIKFSKYCYIQLVYFVYLHWGNELTVHSCPKWRFLCGTVKFQKNF